MILTIIGSGNVATHLALALKNAGHIVNQIYSRNISNAQLLAGKVNAEAISDLSMMNTTQVHRPKKMFYRPKNGTVVFIMIFLKISTKATLIIL